MKARTTHRIPATTRFALAATAITLATVAALPGCARSVPSMIERMPPGAPAPEHEAFESDRRQAHAGPGSTTSGTANPHDPAARNHEGSETGSTATPSRPTRLVVHATIESIEPFIPGLHLDAYVPHEEFRYLAHFTIRDVVEGTWEKETMAIVIRSGFEQFAFPHSERRDFTLDLTPTRGREYHLVGIDPSGQELNEIARRKRADERADDPEGDEPPSNDTPEPANEDAPDGSPSGQP